MPTVLVVDDEEPVRRLLAVCVARLGAAALEAADGAAAVDLYRRLPGRIDLVIRDVNLPDRTGPEVLAELRRIDPAVRCCFATDDDGAGLEGLAAGVLRKPLRLADIEDALWRLADG